jgi:phosphate transport system substrate-binding protein
MMKKFMALASAAFLLALTAAGCAGGAQGKINLITREEGSGTWSAFVELFGVEEKDADGNKVDRTVSTAETTSSTAVMMTSVAGDRAAIGYISLGTLNDTVKALSIDGVVPSVQTVKEGGYTIARPFNIATKGDLSPAARDFIAFMMSAEGQDVVEADGYIRIEGLGAFAGAASSGKVVVAGSTSVTPLMQALKEAYEALNAGAEIQIQTSDSTIGMTSVISGICDIGMASREAKASELEQGIEVTTIATDGIVVIVNKENTVDNLTKEQVRQIYTGAVTEWSSLG